LFANALGPQTTRRHSADWAGIIAMTDQTTVTDSVADGTYAVIATGGKQYRVKVGDRIAVERLHAEAGSDVTIDQVLLVGGNGETKIGTPVIDGATVSAHIDLHDRDEKIIVFKFKAKKRYRRRTGHRQELTRLTITGISA
jgi:large subunit ribosomal protein L21